MQVTVLNIGVTSQQISRILTKLSVTTTYFPMYLISFDRVLTGREVLELLELRRGQFVPLQSHG